MGRGGSIFDSVAMLAIMGILAGALGGLAVGIVTGRPASSSSPTTSTAR
jgi:hypothetical protein